MLSKTSILEVDTEDFILTKFYLQRSASMGSQTKRVTLMTKMSAPAEDDEAKIVYRPKTPKNEKIYF